MKMSEMPGNPVEWALQAASDVRRAELKRMRWFATGLLLLMLVLFVGASWWRARWPWLDYVHAFTEAAMVGACADWFAVVSLFRHPLGVPLPHTAVIARHKARIGENFGTFVAHNFLTPDEIGAKLEGLDVAGWGARWLKQPEHARQVAARLQRLFPSLLAVLGSPAARAYGLDLARRGVDAVAAAPLLGQLLGVLMAHGYHERAFEAALDRAQTFIDAHKDNIRRRVSESSSSWMPGWVDSKVTDAFLAELQKTIDDARASPEHAWRQQYRAMLDELALRLADDPGLYEQGERIKAEMLDSAALERYFDWLAGEATEKLRDDLAARDGVFEHALAQGLAAAAAWLDDNREVRALVNRWARKLVLTAIVPNRQEIGAFISGVVARWDTATLIDKLELQVGKDLQYIRINGTLIGGLVGLVIFVAQRWAFS